MKEFTKHHDIVAQIKTWFAQKNFTHVTMSEKINFIGNLYDKSFARTELVLSSSVNNFFHVEVWVTNDGAIGFGIGHPENPAKLICGHQPVHIHSKMVLTLLDIIANGACVIKKSWLHFLGFRKYSLFIKKDDLQKIQHFDSAKEDYSYATHYILPCEKLPRGRNVFAISAWR